ncbi:MAG: hypothetical protein RR444_12465 [Oscillospiraceae bacterium]
MIDIREHGGVFGGSSGKSKEHGMFSSANMFLHVDEDSNMYYSRADSIYQVLVYNLKGILIRTFDGFSQYKYPLSANKEGYVYRDVYGDDKKFLFCDWNHTVVSTLVINGQITLARTVQYSMETRTWVYFAGTAFVFLNDAGLAFTNSAPFNIGNNTSYSFSGGHDKSFMLEIQQFGSPIRIIGLRLDLPNTDRTTRRDRIISDQYTMYATLLTMDLANTII